MGKEKRGQLEKGVVKEVPSAEGNWEKVRAGILRQSKKRWEGG